MKYKEYGKGNSETIILLHGGGLSWWNYREAAEILKVKKAMAKERPDLSRAIITYHLDKDNINRYKPKTYEEIYHH